MAQFLLKLLWEGRWSKTVKGVLTAGSDLFSTPAWREGLFSVSRVISALRCCGVWDDGQHCWLSIQYET